MAGDYSSNRILAALLDDRQAAHIGASKDLFVRSEHGIGVLMGEEFSLAPHTDKIVCVLAALGIPCDRAILVKGETCQVEHLVLDAFARFNPRQVEMEWTAVALSRFAPPHGVWANRFKRNCSLEEVAAALLAKEIGSGPCHGTHVPYAIATMLSCDAARSEELLSPTTRANLSRRLRKYAALLEATQHLSGVWSSAWSKRPDDWAANKYHEQFSPKSLLWVTGHHLEWMALAAPDCRPKQRCIERAFEGCLSLLADRSRYEAAAEYGPQTHAARALCLLAGVDPVALVSESSR